MLFSAILGELPSMVVFYFLIEIPSFGRKNSLFLVCLLLAVSNLMCYYQILFDFSLGLARFCFRGVSIMVYVYTTEEYKTSYRAIGIAYATCLGRVGTIIMPYIVFPLLYFNPLNPYLPFMAFALFSIICAFCAFTLPQDKTGLNLDTEDVENELIETNLIKK